MGTLAIYEAPSHTGALTLCDRVGQVAGTFVAAISSGEPRHLKTWLEVQLRAAGRAVAQESTFVCTYAEVEALAREFDGCSADASLRQRAADEALTIYPQLGAQPGLARRVLELSADWGNAEAGRELLAALLAEGGYAKARQLLQGDSWVLEERWLCLAEISWAEGDAAGALSQLQAYFDHLRSRETLDEATLEQVCSVLAGAVEQPGLQLLFEHPTIVQFRSALHSRAHAQGQTALAQALQPLWQHWLTGIRTKLLVAAAALLLMVLARDRIVPVLLVLLLPLGLLGFVANVVRRRK